MTLRTYRKKRNFKTTREPYGKKVRGRKSLKFVIQMHAASHLHYDFRLEADGVLKSWAVPKGPSLDPSQKRLAVKVEDHPLQYGSFEGSIPKGEYGGGEVIVWDSGTWSPTPNEYRAGLKGGKLKFQLHGKKLKGGWTLVRMGGPRNADGRNWLLIKENDKFASTKDITASSPGSVLTKRKLNLTKYKKTGSTGTSIDASRRRAQIRPSSQKSNRVRKAKAHGSRNRTQLPNGAVKRPFPDPITPQLATLASEAPAGSDWIHETKFDGYRLIALKDGNSVSLLTRNNLDWTDKFRNIAGEIASLPQAQLILDGEACMIDQSGHSSFSLLQNAFQESGSADALLFAFDLLYLDGWDLRPSRLIERKKVLEEIIASKHLQRIHYTSHIEAPGDVVFSKACRFKWEGIISKKRSAPYTAGRSRSWLKTKCINEDEFAIVGYTPYSAKENAIGALLLGVKDKTTGKMLYRGKVGTGFSLKERFDLYLSLFPHSRSTPIISDMPVRVPGARWVDPTLVAQLSYTELTTDGALRHPSFLGLRLDKQPNEVIEEKKIGPNIMKTPGKVARGKPATKKSRPSGKISKDSGKQVHDVIITHPDKVLFPEEEITKAMLADYYAAIEDRMLPYVKERALSLLTCPTGRKFCFFQKHLSAGDALRIPKIMIKDKHGEAKPYSYIADGRDLTALVQINALEIHPWQSSIDKLERPNLLIMDLDPGPGVEAKTIIEGAFLLRRLLRESNLESFVRVTGGKGIHVVAPLEPVHSWDEVKEFAKAHARVLEEHDSSRFISVSTKNLRGGKIFVDYLRNDRGATAIANYSIRAREGAPVAVPLTWEELKSSKGLPRFDIKTVLKRLKAQRSDPWKSFFTLKQRIQS